MGGRTVNQGVEHDNLNESVIRNGSYFTIYNYRNPPNFKDGIIVKADSGNIFYQLTFPNYSYSYNEQGSQKLFGFGQADT